MRVRVIRMAGGPRCGVIVGAGRRGGARRCRGRGGVCHGREEYEYEQRSHDGQGEGDGGGKSHGDE